MGFEEADHRGEVLFISLCQGNEAAHHCWCQSGHLCQLTHREGYCSHLHPPRTPHEEVTAEPTLQESGGSSFLPDGGERVHIDYLESL